MTYENGNRIIVAAFLAAMVLIVSLASAHYIRCIKQPRLPANIDAILTLSTQADTIYLTDGAGVNCGSISFGSGDEVTVTLKRKR